MVRQPLDQSAASAQLRQEVVGVRAADPLRGVRHFQDVTAHCGRTHTDGETAL